MKWISRLLTAMCSLALIVREQAIIERLEERIAQLEGGTKSGGPGWMPGLKPKGGGKPDRPKKPR